MSSNPLVSYCIFSYQQEDYIKQTIHSALNQTFSPLEIIISDDFSSDATFSVIQETVKEYKGPHKIILNRNEKNLGIGAHFSKVAYDLANGDYIITIGGDDTSKINHVEDAVRYMEKYKECAMVDFNATFIDQHGNLLKENILAFDERKFTIDDFLRNRKISWFAPGRIIKRETIVSFPRLASSCPTEDSIVVFRSLLRGGFMRVNETLVNYRRHESNLSGTSSLSRMSNSNIISQQISDLIFLKNTKGIDDSAFETVLKRLTIELSLRKVKYSHKKNILDKLSSRLKVLYLIFLYKVLL